MSRKWKPDPVHLPGWDYFRQPAEPKAKARRRRKARRRHRDRKHHPHQPIPQTANHKAASPIPTDPIRSLVVTDAHGCFWGQLSFLKKANSWTLIGASRRLSFLHQTNPQAIPMELTARGWSFRWLPAKTQSPTQPEQILISGRPEVTTGVL